MNRRRIWGLVGMLAGVTIAVCVYYLSVLGEQVPIQAGMNEQEVREALGLHFVETDGEYGCAEWVQGRDCCYIENPNWLGYRRMYIVHYDCTGKVQSWKRGELPLERPPWLNGLLKPIGW